jgi:alcohol dehydrogenase class IV
MTDTQNLVLWSFPTRVVLGEGAAAQCANEAHQLGATRVLLVSDRGIEQAGLLDSVRSALDAAGLAHESALEVSSNPLESEVLGAARVFDEFKADLVLGVGGGSVLDVASAVRRRDRRQRQDRRAAPAHDRDPNHRWNGQRGRA